MNKLVFGLGMAVLLGNPVAQARISMDIADIAKSSCLAEIKSSEDRLVPLKAVLDQAARLKEINTETMVIPAVATAVNTFMLNVDQIDSLISAETRELMTESNEAYEALAKSTYSEQIKSAMRNEFIRRFDRKIVARLKTELQSVGNGWTNGNRVVFQSDTLGFQVVYAAYDGVPAGSIVYQVVADNRPTAGNDGNKLVTVRLEFRRNAVTKVITGIPKSLLRADIEAMFNAPDRHDFNNASVYHFSAERVKEVTAEIKSIENSPTLKECREIVKKDL